MTRCITTRSGRRVERLSCYHGAPRIYRAGHGGNNPPSVRMGERWKALPVEGAKAWQRSRPSLLSRLFNR